MKGWVYVATMADIDGVVKIGYSIKDPTIRIKEWSEATGAPAKADLAYAALVENPRKAEAAVHRHLKQFNTKGEWFRVPPLQAMAAIKANGVPLFEEGSLVTTTTDAEKNQAAKHLQKDRRQAQKKQKISREFEKAKKQLLSTAFGIVMAGVGYFVLKQFLGGIGVSQ
jgi:hypothetical protein